MLDGSRDSHDYILGRIQRTHRDIPARTHCKVIKALRYAEIGTNRKHTSLVNHEDAGILPVLVFSDVLYPALLQALPPSIHPNPRYVSKRVLVGQPWRLIKNPAHDISYAGVAAHPINKFFTLENLGFPKIDLDPTLCLFTVGCQMNSPVRMLYSCNASHRMIFLIVSIIRRSGPWLPC